MTPTLTVQQTKTRTLRRVVCAVALTAIWLGAARDAAAQLDPLLFLKRNQPNVLLVVDTANRMQRDPNGVYLDANIYTKTGALWEPSIGVPLLDPVNQYRRKYFNLQNTDPAANAGDKFSADVITTVLDSNATAFAQFDEQTRLAVSRRAMIEAINRNLSVARFGLIRTRQNNPRIGAAKNDGPVKVTDVGQQDPTETGNVGKWKITRPEVDSTNGSIGGPVAPLVKPDTANANALILSTLALGVRQAGALVPAGRDGKNIVDAPIDTMLDDAKAEASRLTAADTACRNTVAVMIVGGARGTTSAGDPAAKALEFLNIGANHRVPIHVIAITPPAGDVAQLQSVAANSGGIYTEITPAMVAAVTPGQPVPEMVRAINFAVQHAFVSQTDLDTDPTLALPIGPATEHQVTSPIVGTVNLEGALDINGSALINTIVNNPTTGVKIPQRSNVMVTTGFSIPGFDARLRAFRVYEPVEDITKPSGFKFVADGTPLWVAKAPDAASRNIFTALDDGSLVPFDATQAAVLNEFLKTKDEDDAIALIEYIRSQPLGAIVSSTPAIMDPPSLDPPPDEEYPGFAAANAGRRSTIWVGGNDGMLRAIDARTGFEVWAFIPYNLLPKLHTLRNGQPVGDFRYFVDSSPKVADVKIDGAWRTYLIIGEGMGGTFYQAFDVTLEKMENFVTATNDDPNAVLAYFKDPLNVPLRWAFPKYSSFDPTITPFGDIALGATDVEKSVGETWSDPAVGQIQNTDGPYAVLTGSGFMKHSIEQKPNRNKVRAGTTLYVLDAKTGEPLASRDVGSDAQAETVDNCAAANNCAMLKNALQADPVATGPPDSRFITKVYVGDLDGRIWRFDLKLDDALKPAFATAPTKLFDAGASHPNFSSMATVNIGNTNQYLFQGTGSDLLPSNGVSQNYKLLGILDQGGSGSKTAEILLEKTDGVGNDEKVTSFPAVAGDIVFFSTTTFKSNPCTAPDGNLYAFTFIGGAAYDTNNDGRITTGGGGDSVKIRTSVGARASAPFVVDQHLVFAAGNKVELFGDPEDFNNGVGQAGVRILSWREVR